MRIRKVQNLVSVKRVNIIDASCRTRISTKEWKLEINFVFGKLQGIRSKYFKLSCLYFLLYVYFILFFCVVVVFKYIEAVCQLIPNGSLREVRRRWALVFFSVTLLHRLCMVVILLKVEVLTNFAHRLPTILPSFLGH